MARKLLTFSFSSPSLLSGETTQAGKLLINATFTGLNTPKGASVADKKVIFIAFAIEDERQRDFLKGQSLLTECPFEYVDMSVKEAYSSEWKEKVRTRIKRSDGVVALVSADSLTSSGQQWEIQCAKEEGKKIYGLWAYKDDRTQLAGVSTNVWTWDGIKKFIDSV